VNASFSESIQTSQSLIAQQLTNLTTDPAAGGSPVVDSNQNPVTINGDPLFAVRSTRLGLTENTFRQQIFRLGFSGTRRRNTFSGGGFWEERHTESTSIKETNFGGNLAVRRKLSTRLNGSVGIAVQMTDFGTADKREQIDYNGSTALSYQVRNDIRATLSYNLTLTKVNNAPDDLLENSVSIGLSKSF
jgi:outer membrane protein assembly factor BamA